MNANLLGIWIVALSLSVLVFRTLRAPGSVQSGWIVVSLLVSGLTAVTYLLEPDVAGYIGGGFWAVFVLAPSLLARRVSAHVARQDWQKALFSARLAARLHPADGWPQLPMLLEAFSAEGSDQDTRLRALAESGGVIGHAALAQYFAVHRMWPELIEWIERDREQLHRPANFFLATYLIRALGETGQLDRMVEVFDSVRGPIERAGDQYHFNLSLLLVLCFSGKVDAASALLETGLQALPPDAKRFWQATARLAADEGFLANDTLFELLKSALPNVREGARDRLDRRIAVFDRLASATTASRVETLAQESLSRTLVDREMSPREGRPVITYTLIGLNLLCFGAEIVAGGSTDPVVLFSLGALHTEVVARFGEWWRAGTALFLHFGVTHLAANMLGLSLLGPFVERMLGRRRYLACYLLSGVGSFLVLVWLTQMKILAPSMVVGASGGVMGLVGATGAVFVVLWRRFRQARLLRQAKRVLLIVVFQMLFDWLTPEVSFTAHLSGALIGFLLSILLGAGRSRS